MRRSIFLLCWLFSIQVIQAQQNCNCTKLGPQQLDELINQSDSVQIKTTILALQKSRDQLCIATAFQLEISYLLSQKQLTHVPVRLASLDQLIQQMSCKEQYQTSYYLLYASYYKITQNYEELSRCSFKALALAENTKNQQQQLKAISYIVHLFTRQKEEEKNWDYIKKAEKIILGLTNDYAAAEHLNWLAFEYERKFTLTERMSLLDSAVLFAKRAKIAAIATKDYKEIARCYRVFESNAYNHGLFKEAVAFIDSAIDILKLLKVPANPSSLYFAKAWDYMDLKSFKEAERWQDSSIYYAEKYEGRTPATMTIYGEASKLFETTGNLPKAIATLKTYNKIKDSVFQLQRLEKINELEEKYNKAKNEKTIEELAQQKRIYLLLAIIGLLSVLAIAFFLRQQSLKHKKDILETEQRLNRARMNPHFFFNALASLQKFALQEKDGQAMASNLSKFSHIMRETLESTYKEYVTIEQEMEFLNEYLEVQKIRFPKTFSYEVRADKALDIDELQIPAMIIQPFVENSIEHGFVGVDYPGHLSIDFSSNQKELQIQIIDNGKGLSSNPTQHNEHISRASQIIKDRIYLLNIKLKTKARFSIDNQMSGQGVIVTIHLPLLYTQPTKR